MRAAALAAVSGRPYQESGHRSLANRSSWHVTPAQRRASRSCWATLPGRSKTARTVGSSRGPS
eukprot:8684623-Lingulodinium_polyedra.AAC.1